MLRTIACGGRRERSMKPPGHSRAATASSRKRLQIGGPVACPPAAAARTVRGLSIRATTVFGHTLMVHDLMAFEAEAIA
jgi:hypothetical protein